MPSPLTRPLPEPPDSLRQGPLRADAWPSPLHDREVTARLGRWLGIAFAVCFVTGLISHYLQHPPSWLTSVPSRPVWGYRVSQGIHVATGIASVPLLLAKLWAVSPRLWSWPPVRSVLHGLERLSILALVAAALFEVASGLLNVVQWYPWSFFFPRVHYYVAYVAIGSIALHVAVKAPVIAQALRRPVPDGDGRRGFLLAVGAAVATVTVVTVGQTLRPLAPLAVLAPRRPDVGPQGLPVNRTAAGAGMRPVTAAYRLAVDGPRPYALTLAELRALPQHEAELPIACVEGWSANARWRGVRLRDLLDRAGAPAGAAARVTSMERDGLYRESIVDGPHAGDELTLLALEVNGEPLALDHGSPVRLIAPNRPGVLQTKWVGRVEVL
ncbi:MAG TPA: molybdopterin-dependent oxidoreductase [Mycobacteriales bacterium]|nr:molybdopterin-dependent oxidoreductase [Mycobacteriales bacterium]